MPRLWVTVVLCVASLACMSEVGEGPPTPVNFKVSAIQGNCSGSGAGDALQKIARLRVDVVGPGYSLLAGPADFAVDPSTTSITMEVPVGSGRIVTLLGYTPQDTDTPSYFARVRNVTIVQGEADSNTIEAALTRFGGFTCVTPPTTLTHRIFPVVVDLGDGRLLIAGGFTKISPDKVNPNRYYLENPSKQAFIFEPSTGKVEQIQNPMLEGRAAFGAALVTVPRSGELLRRVILVGGAQRMAITLTGTLDIDVDLSDAISSYEVLDVDTLTFSGGIMPDCKSEKLPLKRIFPVVMAMSEGHVVIAGGGPWKDSSQEYRRADVWDPNLRDGCGGFVPPSDASPFMNSLHNAAAVARFSDTQVGTYRYVLAGGTTNSQNYFEIFVEPSRIEETSGIFINVPVSGLGKVYFPLLAPLTRPTPGSAVRYLYTGGITPSGQGYKLAEKAFVVTIQPDLTAKVQQVADATGCPMRFLGAAVPTFDRGKVVLLGGFADYEGAASAKTCFFYDSGTKGNKNPLFEVLAPDAEQFLGRAGFAAVGLSDDRIVIVGGIRTPETLQKSERAMFEIFTPPIIDLDLWQ